jgi:RND family efflux transporter MFP subunit
MLPARHEPQVFRISAWIAAALAVAAGLAGCHKKAEEDEDKKPPVEVRCVVAARAAVDETVVLRGRTATPPGGDLPVAAQVAGRVTETRVHEGDRLTKGTVIATVDDLAPRAAEKEAGAALSRARAADAAAQSALTRSRDLAARGIVSKKDVEEAVLRAEAAHAEVEAETAALRLATGTLGRVEVRSTFDGVVTRVFRGAGALVDGTAATPIIQLAAADAVELVADATERELGRIKEGQKVEITLANGDQKLAGVVVSRARALDPSTGLGAVRVRVTGEAKADDHDDKDRDKHDDKDKDKHDDKDEHEAKEDLGPPPLGAFGRAVIHVARREGVLVIPAPALRGASADGAEIAVCKKDKVEIRSVEVGYRDAEQIEVVKGLKPDEKVAIDHVLGLDEESKIVETDGGPGKDDDDKKGDDKKGEGKKDDDDRKKPEGKAKHDDEDDKK